MLPRDALVWLRVGNHCQCSHMVPTKVVRHSTSKCSFHNRNRRISFLTLQRMKWCKTPAKTIPEASVRPEVKPPVLKPRKNRAMIGRSLHSVLLVHTIPQWKIDGFQLKSHIAQYNYEHFYSRFFNMAMSCAWASSIFTFVSPHTTRSITYV